MGSGGGTNTVTENSKPWEGQQPYLTYMYARAQEALERTPKTAYGGQTLAEPNAQQREGLGMASAVAKNQIPQAQQQLQGLINNAPQFGFDHSLTSGWGGNVHWQEAARPDNLNQFISQASEAAIRPVEQNLMRKALPGITNQAISQGAYGGGRQDISEALAVSEAQRNALDMTSQVSFNAHEAEAQRAEAARQQALGRQFSNFENNLGRDFTGWQQNQDQLFRGNMASFDANTKAELARYAMTPGLIDQSVRLGGQGAEIMAGIGDTFQGWDQARLDDAQARWNAQAQAPWNGLSNYAGIVAGAFPGGQSTQTSPANRASKAQGAVTGAMGGAALGGSLAAAGLVGGPLGIGLGAGLGLLGGML